MYYKVKITDATTQVKNSFGEQSIEVLCTAIFTEAGFASQNSTEKYSIIFRRDPISGRVRSVKCENRKDATENTLIPEKVEEIVEDYLSTLS